MQIKGDKLQNEKRGKTPGKFTWHKLIFFCWCSAAKLWPPLRAVEYLKN